MIRLQQSRVLLAASLLPFLILAAVHWPIGPQLSRSDYAQYILHAEALLHGRRYTDIGYIYSRFAPYSGPVAYPPGLPLTLLPLLAAFGRNDAVFKMLEVVTTLIWLWLAGRCLERVWGSWLASAAVMMTGVAVETAFATNVVNSDLGFAAFVWALILIADAPGVWSWRRALVVSALGAAAMSYRVVGIALVPALVIFAALRWKQSGRWAAVPALVWVGAAVVAVSVIPVTTQYGTTVLANPSGIPWRVGQNVRPLRLAIPEAFLYPFPGDRLNDIYHGIGLILASIGLVGFLRKHLVSCLGCFVVCYALVLLIAPAAAGRYWWPIFPLFAVWLLSGAEGVLRLATRSSRRVAPGVFAGATALCLSAVVSGARSGVPETWAGQKDVNSLFAFLRQAPDAQNARVYFVDPRVLTLETGIPAMPLINVPSNVLLSELRRNSITYVVSGDLGIRPNAQRVLDGTIAQHRGRFDPIFRNASFTLYRLVGD